MENLYSLTFLSNSLHFIEFYDLVFLQLSHGFTLVFFSWSSALVSTWAEQPRKKDDWISFWSFRSISSPKSQIRTVLQQRLMGNYVALTIYAANLATLILSVCFFCLCLKFLIIFDFFSPLFSRFFVAPGCDMCSDCEKARCVFNSIIRTAGSGDF